MKARARSSLVLTLLLEAFVKYPVTVHVDPQLQNKSRLTTAFRPLLAIPHAIVVGPIVRASAGHDNSPGLLTMVAYFLAVVSWFAILVTGRHPKGIRDFCLYYLRWRTRALAYMALFVDKYPPFGDEPYPATIEIAEPSIQRDAVGVALRLLLAVPHLLALVVLLVGWLFVTIAAWFIVLFTGLYPVSLYRFALGVMTWALRVEAYLLLLVDEYPPFSLDSDAPVHVRGVAAPGNNSIEGRS